MTETEGIRYRSILSALATLRGRLDEEREPLERAVPYRRERRRRRGIAPLADIYGPPSSRAERKDSVVLVHGGGFVLGARDMLPMRRIASRLSDAGWTVASVDYRLIFRGGRLDEALDDVRAALAWWTEQCERRGLDPDRISLLGTSAGATLAMLVAGEPSCRVASVVSCFGLYEFDRLRGAAATFLARLLFGTSDRERWRARSPSQAATPRAPTLLMHGTDDGLVPVEQARRLAARRSSLGLPTTLELLEGAPHAFFNRGGPHAERGLDAILAHLDSAATRYPNASG